jgi:hypothetical protein
MNRREEIAPKGEGIAPLAFGISTVFLVILLALVIILLILYFRRDSTLIKTENCPEKITGVLASPDRQINAVATNCGSQADCTFLVNSLSTAVQTCNELGSSKCAAFTLKQINNTNGYTMTVSSETGNSADPGSDTYRIIA